MIRPGNPRSRQRGGIAVIAALSGAVLLGFIGIALDVGRLYINKTELQTAADERSRKAPRSAIRRE